MKHFLRFGILALALALIPTVATAAPQPIKIEYGGSYVQWFPQTDYKLARLTVGGPDCLSDTYEFRAGEAIFFEIFDNEGRLRPDGTYTFDLTLAPFIKERPEEMVAGGDAQLCRGREGLPDLSVLTSTGYVTIFRGKIAYPEEQEDRFVADTTPASESALVDGGLGAVSGGLVGDFDPNEVQSTHAADQVILDDLIVDGSACIGFDCVNGESFGFDTIRLKENNLRIKFDDTSVAASFPRTDWQLTANASANGGASKFSIDDISGSRTPFTVEANARSHSLYVDDGGRVGIRTSTPSTEIHVIDGDTPTLRLQQDGSSGFAPQTWDVAGNETNFFIRDVSSGSTLPFRIRPGAPTSSIFIDVDGDVGLGTASPDEELHVLGTGGDTMVKIEETNGTSAQRTLLELENNGRVEFRLTDSNSSSEWVFANANNGNEFIATKGGTGVNEMVINATTGDMTIAGDYFSDTCGGSPCAPDYVFEPDYELMPLAELESYIKANKHLPNIPSAEEMAGPINMSQLQLKMLEKLEELTLYTLEQERTILELRERLAALEDGE
ncbi:MAG: hypothetical protein AAF604_06690 [Acidobacteriota bacterium]